jgi:hypothetical protein
MKQLLQKAMVDYQQTCLRTFSSYRKGEVIQKIAFPKPREVTITEESAKFQEMFDQAMHHGMINQSSVLMSLVQNVVRETIAGGIQMEYKGPCYSHLESSATAGARAGSAAVLGIGIQPQPNAAQTGVGGYPMPPYLLPPQAHQPMVTPIPTALVFTPSSSLKVSSAHGGLFSTPEWLRPQYIFRDAS